MNSKRIYYFVGNVKIEGVHPRIINYHNEVYGNCTYVIGDLSKVKGCLTGIMGDASNVEIDLDSIFLTIEERRRGIKISDLIERSENKRRQNFSNYNKLFFFYNGKRHEGIHAGLKVKGTRLEYTPNITGDCSKIYGEIEDELIGDVSLLSGPITNIIGNVSNIEFDFSKITPYNTTIHINEIIQNSCKKLNYNYPDFNEVFENLNRLFSNTFSNGSIFFKY